MTVINDSDAVLDKERILPQHQAALTLIQNIVEDPRLDNFSWLDLCCGRGQLIYHLDDMINSGSRSKISYCAYDVQSDFVTLTQKKAESLGFKSLRVEVGDIGNYPVIYTRDQSFDFITLTNTVHEINVHILSRLYVESLLRLSDNGCLFIYDMESLPKLELGAITWTGTEMQEIFNVLFDNLGIPTYKPTVSRVRHKTTICWSIQLKRAYFGVSNENLVEKSQSAVENTQVQINKMLREKFDTSKAMLDSLTKYGSDSRQEENELQSTLYDFWALSRALEVIKP
ncbi:class I SAM-dependent methyltransferase [Paenibacillus lutrae]|nr:class I SAM-dependent methyltransferase [Paenibacillus lutrae]